MIGKLLATASAVEEDRVLTTVMRPGCYVYEDGRGPCLVGTMVDYEHSRRNTLLDRERFGESWNKDGSIECHYDELCEHFGVEKINTLIRNRILDNRVKRALKGVKSNEQRTLAECG